jgi:hypothetical protein
MKASPGRIFPAFSVAMTRTLSPIAPRCTGRCGALAMRPPAVSNSAQEKSSRSLMLTECAVLASVTPILSAIDMKRLLNISSMTGSARVPTASRFGRGVLRVSTR